MLSLSRNSRITLAINALYKSTLGQGLSLP
jgi:hypothetical protein